MASDAGITIKACPECGYTTGKIIYPPDAEFHPYAGMTLVGADAIRLRCDKCSHVWEQRRGATEEAPELSEECEGETDPPAPDFRVEPCECAGWAQGGGLIATKHHPSCARYTPMRDAREIIDALLTGIEAWAADEDGVHPECWGAYERACLVTGQANRPDRRRQ